MAYDMPLTGKTALVTGGARRLGAAMAMALADSGAHVILHYNKSETDAKRMAEKIKERGVHAWTVQGDLSDSACAGHIVERAVSLAGPLDILLNSASIFDEMPFAEATAKAIHDNVTINALAPMLMARAFAHQGRHGAIINMVDTMVMDYDKRHVPYHLSKRMLHALTRIMAVEFAPAIRVNAVAPGLILPPPGKDMDWLERLAHTNPLQRYGAPHDVTAAVLFLLRADFITGQTIYVDGGRHLKGRMYE